MDNGAIVVIILAAMITLAILIYKCYQSSQSIKEKRKELNDQSFALFEEKRTLEESLGKLESLYGVSDQKYSYKYAPLKERIDRFIEWANSYAQREHNLWKNIEIFKQRINKKAELYRNLDSIREKRLDFICVYDSLDEQEQEAIARLSELRGEEERALKRANELIQSAKQTLNESESRASNIISNAKLQASNIVSNAELQASNIISNARSQANEIVSHAHLQAQASDIVSIARSHASDIISNAKTQANDIVLTADAYAKKIQKKREELIKLQSSIFALPYLSGIRADFETQSIELLADSLDWGKSVARAEKVASIRQIRVESKAIAERHIQAKYQLEYLLAMFPALEDVLDTEYGELPSLDLSDASDYDRTKDWLSREEYKNLNTTEKNQLALDRYRESKRKSKWQIGRDYELFVGYELSQNGYSVDYFGSYMGLEDLGRDLVAKKNKKTIIVQCKYWSAQKQIHEKHVLQLYGTLVSYCIEHKNDLKDTVGVLITNITLSDTAKRMAHYLGIECIENHSIGDYPCIKCNIGKDENGERTFIYHLPFDQQYDHTKIEAAGEFFALTVAEAEAAGFRRAFKWFSKGN